MQTQSLTDHLDALQRRLQVAGVRAEAAGAGRSPLAGDRREAAITAMFASQAYDWLMLAADAALQAEREARRLADAYTEEALR